jgi:hypothetical protein
MPQRTTASRLVTIADPDRVWTVWEIAKHAAIGGRGPVVGSSEQVADELIDWVEETDVAGSPGTSPIDMWSTWRRRCGAAA